MSDCERDKTMVQELLELKTKVDGIIAEAFTGNVQFQKVVREGFESVINRRQNKPAELIGTCIYMYNYIIFVHMWVYIIMCTYMYVDRRVDEWKGRGREGGREGEERKKRGRD